MEKSDVSNEEIRKRALNLLDFLISGIPEKRGKTQGRKTEKKVERATDLLVDYKDEEYSKGWYFCVPFVVQWNFIKELITAHAT
jgi:hypothetical protein